MDSAPGSVRTHGGTVGRLGLFRPGPVEHGMRATVVLIACALAIALTVPAVLVAVHGLGPAIGPPVPITIDDPSLVSADWPMYGHDLWGTHFNSAETAVAKATVASLVERWRFDGIGMFGTPAVALGTVYVSTMAGDVVALDATTGVHKWTTSTGHPMTASPAVANGIVYVTDLGANATLWALDTLTGRVLWHSLIDINAAGWGSPIVAGALVIVGNSGGDDESLAIPHAGSVQAFDALTGSLVWRTYTVAPGHKGGPVWTTPAVLNDLVYVGTGNSFDGIPDPGNTAIMAFSLVNGTVVWSTQFEDLGDEDFGASPTVFRTPDGLVLGEAQKNHYHALDPASGAVLWSVPFPLNWWVIATPAVAYGGIFSSGSAPPVDGSNVTDFSLSDGNGSLRGEHTSPGSYSAPAVAGGVAFVPESTGVLHAYDTDTGAELWSVTLPAVTYGGAVVSHGLVYMGTSTGLVVYGLPT